MPELDWNQVVPWLRVALMFAGFGGALVQGILLAQENYTPFNAKLDDVYHGSDTTTGSGLLRFMDPGAVRDA